MKRLPAFVAACVVVPLFVAACEEAMDAPVASADVQGIGADIVYYGMVSFLTASGVREGRVQADTAYAFFDSATVKLKGMRLVFFNPDGTERASVTADAGELDESTDRMVARGNVVLIVLSDGRRIETAELNYNPGEDRIWSDSATVQTLANGTVTRGTAFQSDLDFRNVVIRNIRGGGNIVF
jgi:LPS export ABC transporter protein LptC